jgi:hypothetical protein
MNNLVNVNIADVAIRSDSEGRYCLNDLHKASGGEKRHQPANWLRMEQTLELINELSVPQIRGTEQNQPVSVLQGGNDQGTYVCKELVYAYAMWVSPSFHIKVIRAYHAVTTNTPNQSYVSQEVKAASAITAYMQVANLFSCPLHLAQIESVKQVRNSYGVDFSPYLLTAPAQDNIQPTEVMLEPTELGKMFGLSGVAMNWRPYQTMATPPHRL